MSQRIVCAANKHPSIDVMLIGARHWDSYMSKQFDYLVLPSRFRREFEDGFIDNRGNFLTCTEAWKIAEAAGQIINRCGGDTANGGTLYSENLY